MYLVDTNILIYHFNGDIPEHSRNRLNEIFTDHFNISVITKMEVLGFKGHTDESYSRAKLFLEFAFIIGLSENIVEKVIELKRTSSYKLPDAIITATASTYGLTLVTRNVDDFKGTDVAIYNPFAE